MEDTTRQRTGGRPAESTRRGDGISGIMAAMGASESLGSPARRAGYARLVAAGPYVLFLLLLWLQVTSRKGDELPDTDCYMRLLRVEALHDGQGWHDVRVPRT